MKYNRKQIKRALGHRQVHFPIVYTHIEQLKSLINYIYSVHIIFIEKSYNGFRCVGWVGAGQRGYNTKSI